jgi:hypothetical protein
VKAPGFRVADLYPHRRPKGTRPATQRVPGPSEPGEGGPATVFTGFDPDFVRRGVRKRPSMLDVAGVTLR